MPNGTNSASASRLATGSRCCRLAALGWPSCCNPVHSWELASCDAPPCTAKVPLNPKSLIFTWPSLMRTTDSLWCRHSHNEEFFDLDFVVLSPTSYNWSWKTRAISARPCLKWWPSSNTERQRWVIIVRDRARTRIGWAQSFYRRWRDFGVMNM